MNVKCRGDFSAFGSAAQPDRFNTRCRARGGHQCHSRAISFGAPAGETSEELFARRFDEDSKFYRVRAVERQLLPAYSYQLRQRRLYFPAKAVTKITLTQGEQSLELTAIKMGNGLGQASR